MAYCIKCGRELPEGAAFCPSCGAPASTSTARVQPDVAYASLGARFVAVLIDSIIVFVVSVVLAFPFGVLSFPFFEPVGFFFGAMQVLSWLLWIAYFTYFEGASGQTFGKRLMRIRVVDAATGGPISYGRALVRSILRIVDWLPFLYIIGLILISATAKKQRVGDFAAGTIVVAASA